MAVLVSEFAPARALPGSSTTSASSIKRLQPWALHSPDQPCCRATWDWRSTISSSQNRVSVDHTSQLNNAEGQIGSLLLLLRLPYVVPVDRVVVCFRYLNLHENFSIVSEGLSGEHVDVSSSHVQQSDRAQIGSRVRRCYGKWSWKVAKAGIFGNVVQQVGSEIVDFPGFQIRPEDSTTGPCTRRSWAISTRLAFIRSIACGALVPVTTRFGWSVRAGAEPARLHEHARQRNTLVHQRGRLSREDAGLRAAREADDCQLSNSPAVPPGRTVHARSLTTYLTERMPRRPATAKSTQLSKTTGRCGKRNSELLSTRWGEPIAHPWGEGRRPSGCGRITDAREKHGLTILLDLRANTVHVDIVFSHIFRNTSLRHASHRIVVIE